jgi:uncharacterized membrane protein YccC
LRASLRSWARRIKLRAAILDSVILAAACAVTYLLGTHVITHIYSRSRADDLIGALWAVLATIFVCRETSSETMKAAVSRLAATAVSAVLCLAYLVFLPFTGWGLAVMIGVSVLAVTVIGRPGDAITAAITTAVILVASAVSPQHVWQQPILRLADTILGTAVGLAAAWLGLRVTGRARRDDIGTDQPQAAGRRV